MSSLIHRNCNSGHFPFHSRRPPPSPRHPFEEILTVQLRSLLPIPGSETSVPLPWLSRLAHLLASTLAAAAALFSDVSPSAGADADDDILDKHLDAGVNLLDACNAVSAEISRLRSALLPLHLTLRLLSSSSSDDEDDEASKRWRPLRDNRILQARAAIEEWESFMRHDVGQSACNFVHRMTPVAPPPPPRGRASAVRKAAYAVEAVSKLVMEATIAALSARRGHGIEKIGVSGEWPWAEAFNEVQAAVSYRLGKEFVGDAKLLEAAASNLKATMNVGSEEGAAAEELGSALAEVERTTEEIGRLADGINAVFNEAIKTRDAALNRLRHHLLWRD